MTHQQHTVLDALQSIAKANGFCLIAFTPGQKMTVDIDPTTIGFSKQDPVHGVGTGKDLPRLVDPAPPMDIPKPLERTINPDDLPPKLRDLVSDSGTKRICGQCGMPLKGGSCLECSISPAGNAEPGGAYGKD